MSKKQTKFFPTTIDEIKEQLKRAKLHLNGETKKRINTKILKDKNKPPKDQPNKP